MNGAGARSLIGLVAFSLAIAGGPAHAVEPTGTPKPSRDAPGDKPGRGSPFGTEGGKALESRSPAEIDAELHHPVVERIDVVGNHRTSASLIREHLAFHQGEALTPDAILLSRVRLAQLGIFSRVDVVAVPGSRPNEVIIQVVVEERFPLLVTDLFVGQTAVSPVYGSIAFSVPNILAGVGASVGTALDGEGRHGVRLELYQPALDAGGRTWVAGARLLWNEGLESGCSTPRCDGQFSAIPWVRYRRLGGEVDLGVRTSAFSRFLIGYRFEGLNARSDAGVDPSARPFILEGDSHLSALVIAFDSDSRDDAFLPSQGTRLEANATLSTAALGSNYEYSRYLFQVERWIPQGGGRALRLDFAVGLVQGNAPFFDRFYAADWSYFSVGLASARALNINFSPDSRYDAFLGVLGGEYDVSLWTARGALFSRGVLATGIRAVYSSVEPGFGRTPISATPVSIDVALRMETPIGVIQIGLGYIIDQILKAAPLSFPGINQASFH